MGESASASGGPGSTERLQAENQALRERLERREQELRVSKRMVAEALNQNEAQLEVLEQRTRQLEAVAAVDKALAGVMDPQQVMEMAVDQALEVLGQPIGTIYLVEGEELVLSAHRGFTPEMVARLGRLRAGQGISGMVVRDGKPVVVDDLAASDRLRLPMTGNIRSAAVVPLKWEGQMIGTMGVGSSAVGRLSPEELNCLIALAAPISFFVTNSRQNAQLREKIEELALRAELSAIISSSPTIEPVYESFIVRLKAMAGIARAALLVVEGEQLRIEALYSEVEAPLGQDDTVPMNDTRELLATSDHTTYQPDLEQERRFWTDEHLLKSGIRCNIRIPLRHQAKFVGYLVLHSRHPHAYDDPRLRRLLEEVAGELAPAIANQQLYRELSQSKQRLETHVGELRQAEAALREGEERFRTGIIRDITERRRLQEQLMQADKLAAVGTLVSGVAHEVNNPLTGALGYVDLLLRRDLDEAVKADLQVVRDETQRAIRTMRNLLSFAREHEPEKTYLSINETIESTLALRTYELRVNNVEVEKELQPDLPKTMADQSQLQQVFLNLILNAEQAMIEAHGGGILSVSTRHMGGVIQVTFADDGPGIPEENLTKVFEPFFTTKQALKGTGLGLSICYGIVREHGGAIRVVSEVGKGAAFTVELPVVTESSPPIMRREAPHMSDPGGSLGLP